MSPNAGEEAAAIRVEGRVQGVAFRASARREALRAGVRGWVRNLPDGRVEAALYGEPEAVRRVIDFCRTGPPGARVDRLEPAPELLASDGDPGEGFEIRR